MKQGKTSTHITLDIRQLPEGYFLATSSDVQGLVAQGKTFEEVVAIAENLATILLREQSKSRAHVPYQSHITYPMMVQV